MKTITGVKKAVGEYKRYNKGGRFSPEYCIMMLDRETGEVWTDYFYSIGHNVWKEYKNKAVINLVQWADYNVPFAETDNVNMKNVKYWAEKACAEYECDNA